MKLSELKKGEIYKIKHGYIKSQWTRFVKFLYRDGTGIRYWFWWFDIPFAPPHKSFVMAKHILKIRKATRKEIKELVAELL